VCRILSVKSPYPIDIQSHLEELANISKTSKEYQGHGWGVTYFENNKWKLHKDINPIWESDYSELGESKIFLAHARSAFQDEGITIENNMPFISNHLAFIFNGELRGVKIKEEGRIGAEKIFNYIQRFTNGDLKIGIEKAVSLINKRTDYIRALNFVISDGQKFYTLCQYNEDPEYFNLHRSINDQIAIVSSERYGMYSWEKIKPGQVEMF
jgi:glutamine amidotransferase